MTDPIRIPNDDANDVNPSVDLAWPLTPTTQGTLRRWLDGPTSGPQGGSAIGKITVSDDSAAVEIPNVTHIHFTGPGDNDLTDDGNGQVTLTIGSNSREIFIPAEAMNPTTTSPCSDLTKVEAGTNDVDYWVLDFDQTTAESCFFTLRMPNNWDTTIALGVFVIWTTAGGGSAETVDWGVKARAYADGDAIDQAYGSEGVLTDTRIANNAIHANTSGASVTPSGTLAAGQWLQFKITRKTSTDNLASDARLIGIRVSYAVSFS